MNNIMEEASEGKESVGIEDVELEPCAGLDEAEENFEGGETTTIEGEGLEPCVGMEFDSEQSTYSFYNNYAKRVGFVVRKRFVRRSRVSNEVICRTYVCSREGFKRTKKEVDNPRPDTRSDCKAMMQVRRNVNGKWVMMQFIEEHNHELHPLSTYNPPSVYVYRPQKLTRPKENITRTPRSSGSQISKKMSTKKSGTDENVDHVAKDCRNSVNKEQRESLSVGDAQIIYEYFMRTQVSNPRFFYAMELDEEQRLRNVFWVDTKSRMAYAHFGDVITFDTTYLTNKYETKLVLFVGVNHHGQPVLLGCALVTDETKSSFVWVLKTWLTAMEGRSPKAIITDRHKAIKEAVAEVFPETCHRLCLWDIVKEFPEKLGSVCKAGDRFMLKFYKCIYDSLTPDEFEKRWQHLIETYELKNHEWLEVLYEDRKQWVPVYLKDTFFAGMSTSERSESICSFFYDYVNRNSSLKEFLDQYDIVLQRRYSDEEKADGEAYNRKPELKTESPYESQMSCIYTVDIFKKFQDEVLKTMLCNAVHAQQEEGGNSTYVVKELVMKSNGKRGIKEYTVLWNGLGTTISCICRLFEFKGYLCRHAMVVLFAVGIYEIPSHYILRRWTRDAKNLDVFDNCTGAQGWGPEYIEKCFIDLRADSIKLAEEGSLSKERYKAAKFFLKEALIKVASMDKVPTSCTPYNVKEGNQAQIAPRRNYPFFSIQEPL